MHLCIIGRVSGSHPVAVVFSDKHSPAAVAGFGELAQDVQIHVVYKDGRVETVRGPQAATLAGINAKHVVWVGIPHRWAIERVGSTSLHLNHHVGSRTRFSVVHETVLISRAIEQANEALARDAERAADAAQKAHVESQVARREQRLGAKAPWYIPESLR